jgi:hypothetical protein
MPRSVNRILLVLLAVVAIAGEAGATGSIYGIARFQKIKGKPSMGYAELYEWSLFGTYNNPSVTGFSRRIGTSGWQNGSCADPLWPPGGGPYCKSGVTAGTYSLLLCQPYLFAAPRLIPSIVINDGQTLNQNVELALDYSTYFRDDWTTADNTWIQTFLATGYAIRGVAFTYAGNDPAKIVVSVLKDNGDANPDNWTLLGSGEPPTFGSLGDNWVRWMSSEIPTTPGQRYAIRLEASGGSGALQPYKRNKDGNSYVGGQAYNAGGAAQSFDLNITVFSDNDGTAVTMTDRKDNDRNGGLKYYDFMGRPAYGQIFVSRGASLAAAYALVAGGNSQYYVIRWKVRQGGPGGTQVGSDRLTQASWEMPGAILGVSYNPGEIPLTPCQTYFIEYRVESPSGSQVNPYVMKYDSYDNGMAYRNESGTTWTAMPDDDLNITIMEYAAPIVNLSRASLERTVYKGDSLANDVFALSNVGPGTLCYTITDNASWLSESPTSGCSNNSAIQIIYNGVPSLPKGVHHATITIASNAANCSVTLPVTVTVNTVKPDFDGDTDVDQDDFGHLQMCLSGPGVPPGDPDCADADVDDDGDVDVGDFAVFQQCMSGPGVSAARTCAD